MSTANAISVYSTSRSSSSIVCFEMSSADAISVSSSSGSGAAPSADAISVSSSSGSGAAPSPKRRCIEFVKDPAEDRLSLVLFVLGSVGYEHEADRVARVSKRILESEQIVEGISRFQFPSMGRTRLMYAAKLENLERLKFIADLGARVNATAKGEQGTMWTALHFASRYGHTECVSFLCDRGAVVDALTLQESKNQWTPLCVASYNGHLDVVRILCERGAQIDIQGPYGTTALFFAAYGDKLDVARYLCERGANTFLQDMNGKDPYAKAHSMHGCSSRIALLLRKYPHK